MSVVGSPRNGAASLEDFFENGAIGLHIVAGDGAILRANKAELTMLGYSAEEYVGRHIADFHADADTIADILDRLGRGETLDQYPARLRAKSGEIRQVLISSSVCFDESGEFLNTRCFTVDITERLKAEQELREAEQRLAATYEHALVAISEVDSQGRFLRTNDGMTRITGFGKEELLGRTAFSLTHPEDAAADQALFRRQVLGEIDRYTLEKRYVCADGRVIWVDVSSSTVNAADGSFLYAVRVAHDITEQKRAEERYKFLINELNHRVKNTLATVQSFATQTARTTDRIDQFMTKFEGRLIALSQAHNQLTRRNWEGASLAEIVTGELALHGGERRGLVAQGPDVALPPRAALAISMALHELGTNAAKYGALTVPSGALRVEWSVVRDHHSRPIGVVFRWIESGGPAVSEPHARGFGTRLLEAMTIELRGEGELRFDADGVKWLISFPLSFEAGASASGAPEAARAEADPQSSMF